MNTKKQINKKEKYIFSGSSDEKSASSIGEDSNSDSSGSIKKQKNKINGLFIHEKYIDSKHSTKILQEINKRENNVFNDILPKFARNLISDFMTDSILDVCPTHLSIVSSKHNKSPVIESKKNSVRIFYL